MKKREYNIKLLRYTTLNLTGFSNKKMTLKSMT